MQKKKKPATIPTNLPVCPQPSALEIRETSRRILGHLIECLVDHILLYHQSEESALAALAFSQQALRNRLLARHKRNPS